MGPWLFPRAIGNATGQECFVKGCEITGEVGGIAISVALIVYSQALAKIGNGCHAAGSFFISILDCALSFVKIFIALETQ